MHLDVINLRNFYYKTKLGRNVQVALQRKITHFWPHAKGLTLCGFGFATPVLRPFLDNAKRTFSLMPSDQGAMRWPLVGVNHTALINEFSWPIPTGHIDRLIILHGLETSDHPSHLLGEIWRCLAPHGKVIFVVPNRLGLWSRSDLTPFGYGRPYSYMQIESQLKAHDFLIDRHKSALYIPPKHTKMRVNLFHLVENSSLKSYLPIPAGAWLIEASKQMFMPIKPGLRKQLRRPIIKIEELALPIPKPVFPLKQKPGDLK